MLFWLLLAALLLVCLLALGATLLSLWRRVKVLGREVGAVGETVEQAQAALDAAKADGPLGSSPCPTCGAPASAATKNPVAAKRG